MSTIVGEQVVILDPGVGLGHVPMFVAPRPKARMECVTYVPDRMPQPSIDEAVHAARQVGFATIVVNGELAPAAAHIPVYFDVTGAQLEVRFHLAANNPLVAPLTKGASALLMFRVEPDGYISPKWYDHKNVPTWDYAFVHMTGTPRALDRDARKAHALELVAHFDTGLEVDDAYVERYLDGIRGFVITSPDVQPVFKLSQDKSQATINGIVAGLNDRDGHDDGSLARAIEHACHLKKGK